MAGIHKRFGDVLANVDVNFTVAQGTLHGLIGENGAGKSTLMSVLYGFYPADSGRIEVFGKSVQIRNADDAIACGIGMVHQHFMLVETLTALENVMLGAEPHWHLPSAIKPVRERLEALMQSTGLRVALDATVADLAVGDRQRLEILKALYRGARILILDEPTAVLTPQETQQLFAVLRQLRAQGSTVILITHKLKEVLALCDQVTVMRAGRVVDDMPIACASVEALAQAMVGRKVQFQAMVGRKVQLDRPPLEVAIQRDATPVLLAQGLQLCDASGVQRLADVGLQLRAGEIVGIAGVSGNGQSELLDILSGLGAPDGGSMQVLGRQFVSGAWLDPFTARSIGLAHVPEDRQARALVMDFEAWESAVLGYEYLPQFCRTGWMRAGAMRNATADMMERFDVRPRKAALGSRKFSGGNQQKLVLARELGQAPRVLLVGQPTRGVDIGAIEFIYSQLRAMRDAGCAVLLVSSELDEILALSDRVLVMVQGRVSGALDIADCNEERLGLLMAGAAV
jgi:simple sugar transport system ATP-binding protein